MNRRSRALASVFFASLLSALSFIGVAASPVGNAQSHTPAAKPPQLIWIDTDIGDDIDDAFALGLVLRSPELKPLGISTAFGDTETRARLVDRYLAAVDRQSIPVTAGVHTETSNVLTQHAYAQQAPEKKHADGIAAMLEAIRKYPNQITLLAIGPLFNIGAAIDRDPATFHKLKRVVIMGGSIVRGYDGKNGEHRPADAEWNILCDPKGAAKLFASGVPIFMMPLDSTQIHLLEPERKALFAAGNPLTTQLDLLYQEWSATAPGHPQTPTLFDPVAAAYTFRPELCPMTPMRIEVDAKGVTHKVDGAPNAQVCLKSDEAAFLKLLLPRLEESGK